MKRHGSVAMSMSGLMRTALCSGTHRGGQTRISLRLLMPRVIPGMTVQVSLMQLKYVEPIYNGSIRS